jgi:hypothetical protein
MMRFTLLLFLLIAQLGTSFQLLSRKSVHVPSSRLPFQLRSSADDNGDLELTPMKVKVLRKEMNNRKSTRTLSQIFLSPDESTGPVSKETMTAIVEELKKTEMVQVRSISKEQIKAVWAMTERLALEVGMEMGNSNVFVIEIKGHAATLYSPSDNGEITLRTTSKGNNWQRRVKAERDSSGQVIPGTAGVRPGRRGQRAISE